MVVVTHNGRRWLPSCLEALLRQDYPALDVVVIDNGSEVPVATAVSEIMPAAEVLRLDRNMGFGAAANLALESSVRAPLAEYFLFIHDDVALQTDSVRHLVSTAVTTEAGVVGGKGVSWEDPSVLLEVGMTADQLCYPFSGLEEGEIDQGQHDIRREVLFVTSACCLLSRALIERCGSWDGGYFLFGEDLDLCLRGRMAGFKIVMEPAARFLHVAALSSGARELRRGQSTRFYTRRNRLRTIAKTAATYRMLGVMFVYMLLSIGEVIALAALRRFEEIPSYPRSLASFFFSLPDVVRRRRAVQKRRVLSDRRLRRFMVRDLHRLRVFAERRLRDWELGTLRFGAETLSRLSPARIKAVIAGWIRKPTTLVTILAVLMLGFAMRDVFFGEPIAAGGVYPFPAPTGKLLGEYLSGWREVGLGSSAAPPAALPIVWLASLLSGGGARAAQSFLIAGLLVLGFVGMYRLVARRTGSSWARLLAMAIYGLGPVTEAITAGADLGGLALFAGLPFLLDIGLRMLRPTPGDAGDRPVIPLTTDLMTQNGARLALVSAMIIGLAPSALVALAILWLMAGLISLSGAWDRREEFRRVTWILGSLAGGLVLLLPWSLDALKTQGSVLGPLFSGSGGGAAYGPLWSKVTFERMLFLGSGRILPAAFVAPAIALSALLLTGASRRREARVLTGVWLGFAVIAGFVETDWIPAPVTSPTMWMVVPLAALAVMAGHIVAGAREELPRHVLGWRHVAVVVSGLAIAAGTIGGWGTHLGGWELAQPTLAAPTGKTGRSISSFFVTKSEQEGEFRVLWLGSKWVDPIRASVRRIDKTPYLLTGSGGLDMTAIYDPSPRVGDRRLADTVAALVGGRLHHAGHLVAPASIRYIVVGTDDQELMSAMRRQSDFALEHQQSGIAVFRNIISLPRPAFVPPGLLPVADKSAADDKALILANWSGGRPIPRKSEATFGLELPRTYHPEILLGDNYDRGWHARVGRDALKHDRALGWANRWEIPSDARGPLIISYRRWARALFVMMQAALVAMTLAMARLRSREIRGRLL